VIAIHAGRNVLLLQIRAMKGCANSLYIHSTGSVYQKIWTKIPGSGISDPLKDSDIEIIPGS